MAFPVRQGLFELIEIDHYAVLGAPISGELEDVRQRYLNIARKLHPDTCRLATQAERERANKLLTKLVNPSWEKLSKENTRQEFRAVLAQIGRSLAAEKGNFTPKTEAGQKLYNTKQNIDLAYKNLVKSLAVDQYTSLDRVYEKIANISELNLVYLMLTSGSQTLPVSTGATATPSKPPTTSSSAKTSTPTSQPEKKTEEIPKVKDDSPVAVYLRRAQRGLERGDYNQAILELKDALKLEPNNSECHSLLGMTYFKQNQLTMARIHVKKALDLNPQDAQALGVKRELDKTQGKSESKDKSDKSSSKGGFWNLFGGGGKKK